ncbi:prolipoprotein diacylglyceryl transferase [Pontibacter anaerobius]|uniref:Phosphatidylglycerol--prolipoprotein diacylglyceryl transferase n=1 Tax=Pontibacter anaerobius TaxID=2993940 RepID=A0ABT3RIQ8_9BACT|nr:prolipoprotein diacylglyceryl transferase [Pontibacter anaerobius]MCX2741115.1 prolipoprotein diacylglyceryl transferase [Pontibacter anaerobius]
MTYIHWNPSPVIVDLGFYELRWYSFLFALGFVLSYTVLNVQFKETGFGVRLLDKLTGYIAAATVIGARLGHCLFYDWDYYSSHILEIFLPFRFYPEFEFTGFQGLASHGGIFAIVVAVILFSKKYDIKALWIFDKLSVVGALAGACIRLGNLMNSEIVGKPADVPWAFTFVRVDSIPRHPGQLYEVLTYLAIFAVLFTLDRKAKREPGFIFGLFFVLLFSTRFIIEFFKANQSDFESGMLLNMGQLLSIPFIILGIVLLLTRRKRQLYAADLEQTNMVHN